MKNVLILDSDPIVRLTIGGLVKSHSGLLNVLTAINPREALATIANQQIHLVIAGPGMAEIEDFELMSKIEALQTDTRLIVMTNKSSPMLRTKIKQYPAIVQFDQLTDTSLLMMRIFTELNIDYGGQIRGIQLPSFLQMLELEDRTCTLHISTKGRTGRLFILKGAPIGARIGPLSGKPAALNILTWENVLIEIDYTPIEMQPEITKSLMGLILESGRLVDERHRKNPNQRKDQRFNCVVAIDYDISDWTYQCVIKDLSLGGAYIETEQSIEVGQKIILTLTPPDLERGCTINATVIRNDHMGLAVRFESLSMQQKEVIQFLSFTKATAPSGPDIF
jgi:CheY-like chemotaxis protein